jgi:4-alpha-glucanotransferase
VWKALRERGAKSREAARAMMEVGWSSAASLAMAPLQDLLNLDKDARMNVPGRPDGNWRWRCTKEILSDAAFDWLRILTKNVNRSRNLISGAAKTLETASIN